MTPESDSHVDPASDERVRLHRRASEIFTAAVRLPPAERPAYVDTACGDDTALREEVETLLAHDRELEFVGRNVLRRAMERLSSLLIREAAADGEPLEDRFHLIRNKFPEHRETFDDLVSTIEGLHEACEDYMVCRRALDNPELLEGELRYVCERLEGEIADLLGGSRPSSAR